jgi:hypothetical protein
MLADDSRKGEVLFGGSHQYQHMNSLGGRRSRLEVTGGFEPHTIVVHVTDQLGASDSDAPLVVPYLALAGAGAGFASVDALLVLGALHVGFAVAFRDVMDAMFVILHLNQSSSQLTQRQRARIWRTLFVHAVAVATKEATAKTAIADFMIGLELAECRVWL